MLNEDYTMDYLLEAKSIILHIDTVALNSMIDGIAKIKEQGGRIFFLGVGGSAANASHAVNDFRKIAGIECYAPTDNVAEITARTNDNGWKTVFKDWLCTSRPSKKDAIFILSVGGGSKLGSGLPSENLTIAMRFAEKLKVPIFSIVGRLNGYAGSHSTKCIRVPIVNHERITPHAESFQSMLLHLIVTHPKLRGA
jgi:D-sedoheptulose 7-phosphate isomerase